MRRLFLFMTPGVGLSTWQKLGGIERELKPYQILDCCLRLECRRQVEPSAMSIL